jgi:alpha-beta hydrolase superfamily lysophospholipase
VGIVQVVHGMTDYIGRYESFLTSLAEKGYLAFGYDHLGHGTTVKDPSELGFVAPKNGWRYLVRDVGTFSDAVREEYGIHLPYYLLGHSMGSFIVRLAALEKVKPDKLILMATGDRNPACPFGIALAKALSFFRGPRYVSPLFYRLIFRNYDKGFPGDYPQRWITVDTENLVRYKDDPLCTFHFSVSALGDLIRLNQKSNSLAFFKKSPSETPILLLSGEFDPVGGYGKGVRRIHRRLCRFGKTSSLKLYSGYRHEILQDFCKNEVTEDILSFLAE